MKDIHRDMGGENNAERSRIQRWLFWHVDDDDDSARMIAYTVQISDQFTDGPQMIWIGMHKSHNNVHRTYRLVNDRIEWIGGGFEKTQYVGGQRGWWDWTIIGYVWWK